MSELKDITETPSLNADAEKHSSFSDEKKDKPGQLETAPGDYIGEVFDDNRGVDLDEFGKERPIGTLIVFYICVVSKLIFYLL
jgi:hypothetical protein